ncbi:MAG TPA: GIY-YIG nuclease family protein [Gaiellaceae bacterium]|nr:GIY-YIG nuclease family protein [Gaiellaceae bacterium]
MDKEYVLAEIRRTAEGGKPLGRARFAAATGIKEHDWQGRYWARWSDAVREAGFEPNELQGAFGDAELLVSLVDEIRQRGRMPTTSELKLRRSLDGAFPNAKVFARFGPKARWPERIADYCRKRDDCSDVLAIVAPLIADASSEPEASDEADDAAGFGVVYLAKSGRHYKIGHSADAGRRRYDLAIQLPEAVTLVHEIRTDDPAGIERYWHRRFADRHTNGEWFSLTRADVTAFKRRKFM